MGVVAVSDLTPDFLAALDARLAKATPGPWEASFGAVEAFNHRWWIWGPPLGIDREAVAMVAGDREGEADADLIAHAPEDLRRLRAAYDEAQAEVDRLTHQRDAALADLDARVEEEAAHCPEDQGWQETLAACQRERDVLQHQLAAQQKWNHDKVGMLNGEIERLRTALREAGFCPGCVLLGTAGCSECMAEDCAALGEGGERG